MKCIGYNHSTGNYQGRDYDNYILVLYDKEANEANRFIMDKQRTKIKAADLAKAGYTPQQLINADVAISYNMYGQIQGLTIYDSKVK